MFGQLPLAIQQILKRVSGRLNGMQTKQPKLFYRWWTRNNIDFKKNQTGFEGIPPSFNVELEGAMQGIQQG